LELWPVAKLAVAFHLACAVVTLLALVVVWTVGRQLGTIDRIAKFLADVGFAEDFELKGDVLLQGAAAVFAVLALLNTVITIVLAFLYNSLSGVLGGLIFSVLEEQPRAPRGDGRASERALRNGRRDDAEAARGGGGAAPGRQRGRRPARPAVGAGRPAGSTAPALPSGEPAAAAGQTSSTAPDQADRDDWLRAAREAGTAAG
jgi:hypothetical protein